jgi:hypothetical protein
LALGQLMALAVALTRISASGRRDRQGSRPRRRKVPAGKNDVPSPPFPAGPS